ncbi:MAG: helix-turn-helix transcriptional regulator [Bacteroidales bacterium]|nr:helix-turn-helix transcriptional regulator [Bacteroidales bacterium]
MTELERLREVLELAFLKHGITKKKEMAKFLGYNASYISSLLTGDLKLTADFLDKIQRTLKINANWIKTGQGDMFLEYPANVINSSGDFANNTSNGDLGVQLAQLISIQKGLQQDYIALMREKDKQIAALTAIIDKEKDGDKKQKAD